MGKPDPPFEIVGNQLRFEVYESYDEAEAHDWAGQLAEFTGLPLREREKRS